MGLLDWGKHVIGKIAQDGSHVIGDGLDAVGLHGAASTVDKWGDQAADVMGDQVAELELGQTNDPTDLVHGDVAALHSTVTSLRSFASAFGETASGLGAVDTAHWEGSAGEAFRAKFAQHPKQWSDAHEACGDAGEALSSYADTVAWAQGQAAQAIDMYNRGQQATAQAKTRYQSDVDSYNQAAQAYNTALSAGQNPGAMPTQPAAFTDPGVADRQQAQELLDRARQQRDSSAAQAQTAVSAATNLAPKEPSFGARMLDDLSDTTEAMTIGGAHFLGGVVKGSLGIVNFARSLNPLDPYNVTHPAEFVDGLSSTGAGLVHMALHPTALASALIGSGWSSDPFQSLGNLVPNIALAVGTDGAGMAADAGADIAENAARDAAAGDGLYSRVDATKPEPWPPEKLDPRFDYWDSGRLKVAPKNLQLIKEKYDIQIAPSTRVAINKGVRGIFGETTPVGQGARVDIAPQAFVNEEQLARTLYHENVHAGQLAENGWAKPTTVAGRQAWENAAHAADEQWWQSHPINQGR
jgi:uncharacterized protein YukE